MVNQVITVITFLCLLIVFYVGGIHSATIDPETIAGNTPPCGNYGQENCITHSPPANQTRNQTQNHCNQADLCRSGKEAVVSEIKSEAQISVARKMVPDYAFRQLALIMVLARCFDWEIPIGLFELLSEFCKELSKLMWKEAKKKTKAQKSYDSDDDKNCKEAKLSSLLDDCKKLKSAPPLSFPQIGSWSVLQSFMNNELNSLVGLAVEQVPYSSEEKLSLSACEFWCAILSLKIQVGVLTVEIDWYPSYSELKSALETFWFLFNFSSDISVKNSSVCEVSPQNSITWIKFTDVCCQVRCKHSVISGSDCQELAEVIICLYLYQRLQGLSVLTRSCVQTVISLLAEEEWINSCSKIAKSLASRVPVDLKCWQALQCISEVDPRTQHLKNAGAFQILVNCFGNKELMHLIMLIVHVMSLPASKIERFLQRQSVRFKSQGQEPAAENLYEIDDVKFTASQQLEDGRESACCWSNSTRFIHCNGHCNPRAETQTLTRSSIGRPAGKAVEKVQSYKEVSVNVKLLRN